MSTNNFALPLPCLTIDSTATIFILLSFMLFDLCPFHLVNSKNKNEMKMKKSMQINSMHISFVVEAIGMGNEVPTVA